METASASTGSLPALQSGDVDAVYIAVPNHLHRDYTVRAAEAGVHVLCDNPMAATERECIRMIDACESLPG